MNKSLLTVRYYAGAAQVAQIDEETVNLECNNLEKLRLSDVLKVLIERRPVLETVFPQCTFLWKGKRITPQEELGQSKETPPQEEPQEENKENTSPTRLILEILPPFAGG